MGDSSGISQLQELHGGNIDIFVGVSKFCLPSSEPFPPVPRPQAISAKLQTPIAGMQKREAWKKHRFAWTKIEQNTVNSLRCWTESGGCTKPCGIFQIPISANFHASKKNPWWFSCTRILGLPKRPFGAQKNIKGPRWSKHFRGQIAILYIQKNTHQKEASTSPTKTWFWFIIHCLILRIEGILEIGCFTKKTIHVFNRIHPFPQLKQPWLVKWIVSLPKVNLLLDSCLGKSS